MMNTRAYALAIMVVALIGVFVLMLASTARAEDEVGCVTVGLEWEEVGGANIIEYLTPDNGVNASIVGDFLWLQYNSDGSFDSTTNVLSIHIPEGASEFTACITMHNSEGPDIVVGEEAEPVVVEVAEQVPDKPEPKVLPVLTTVANHHLVEEWVKNKDGFWIL